MNHESECKDKISALWVPKIDSLQEAATKRRQLSTFITDKYGTAEDVYTNLKAGLLSENEKKDFYDNYAFHYLD